MCQIEHRAAASVVDKVIGMCSDKVVDVREIENPPLDQCDHCSKVLGYGINISKFVNFIN